MDLNSFLSWDILATFTGTAACTGLLTQLLKNATGKLPAQWLSYIITFVMLVITIAATGGWMQPWAVWALVPLNAALISLASNGVYRAILRVKNGKA